MQRDQEPGRAAGAPSSKPLPEAWKRAEEHLERARALAGGQGPASFREHLERQDLARAADVLAEHGKEHDASRAFWEALQRAYENLQRADEATVCRLRIYEAEHGFVEAQLTLTPPEAGGRSRPVLDDYRPGWSIGNHTASGEAVITAAAVTLEDARSISPGGSGRVRLHPLWREAWKDLQPGAEITMHEGARVVGRAVVLRVTLREARP